MKKYKSLKKNLIIISIISFLIFIISFSVFLVILSTVTINQTKENNKALVVTIKELIKYYFDERFIHIRNFAFQDDISDKNKFEGSFYDLQYYENILIVDYNGIVRKVIPDNRDMEGYDYSSRSFFKNVKENELFLSDVYTSILTGNPIVTASIKNNNRIIAANININSLAKTIERIKLNKYNSISVIDENGRYLIHKDINYVIQKRINYTFIKLHKDKVNEKKETINYYENIENKRYLITASYIPELKWTVLIFTDYNGELTVMINYIYISLFIAIILLIFVLLFNFRNILFILNSLNKFVGQTDLITKGNYSIVLEDNCYIELKPLSDNFKVMVQSISDREGDIKQLNEDLEKKVVQRTYELERALSELRDTQSKIINSEKMVVLGRISANIAHELNTPIGAITSNSKIIVKHFERNYNTLITAASHLTDASISFIQKVIRNVVLTNVEDSFLDPAKERIYRSKLFSILSESGVKDSITISEILTSLGIVELTKDEADLIAGKEGKNIIDVIKGVLIPIRSAKISGYAASQASRVIESFKTYIYDTSNKMAESILLVSQLKFIFDLFRNKIKGRIEIRYEIDEDIRVWGNKDQINRIWFNLLLNAIQAVDESGVITIKSVVKDDFVFVSIIDNGCGIPEDMKHNIFVPFFSTKPMGEGSGLGLDIAKKLTLSNGGDIRFNSVKGRTEFIVALPLDKKYKGREE